MKSKKLAVLITVNIVFALAIIGLAVGLVLVAQQATLNNQMSIKYEAKNVDVEITASGKKYANKNDTTGEAIRLADSEQTTTTVQFTATQSANETNANINFETVTIDDATGRAVYTFNITNTASTTNTKELKVRATVFDNNDATAFNNDGNVSVRIGKTEALATTMTENITSSTANVGAGGETTTLVVVMSIDNKTEAVNDYNLSLKLDFSYDIAQDDWDGTVGTLPEPVEYPGDSRTHKISITTAEQFAALAEMVNTPNHPLSAYNDYRYEFSLEADLDLMNIKWTPIGYGYSSKTPSGEAIFVGAPEFNAAFNGNGHIIRNLKMEYDANVEGQKLIADITSTNGSTLGQGSAGIGLFGHTGTQARIKNVTVCNALVTGNRYVGVIVGHFVGTSHHKALDNCHVTNAVINNIYHDEEDSGDKSGAISGYSVTTNQGIQNCSATDCEIKAGRDAGQLFGLVYNHSVDIINGGTNTAHNVYVSANGSGTGKNINNTLIGRTASA
ncbi:MAG: hypothetical protein E7361_03800 [Clostridiales bacterium]|nr:hypothetical protein [Clostridiales bacterium]